MDKKALLVIDVQSFFINSFTKHLPKKISKFIGKNRDKFNFILFFKFVNSKKSNWVKVLNWHKMFSSPEIDLVPEFNKFLTRNNVFEKTAFSCFKSKKFIDFSKKNKVKEFYICGLDTHACIYCTTMEAFELGFNVKVIKDLCAASHGDKYHKNSLEALKRNLTDKVLINSNDL